MKLPNFENWSNGELSKSTAIQGVRGQSGFFNWALTEINIQVTLYLKVFLK